ncbi:hypothetical protein IW261DRAFT_1422211 [Armillaria novae-zelandiae]|uniref:Uncharacterized protein n=1 Tax=Armillaria novae-zelandiae TaxID=153914 RepID=A0AA39P0Q1_9AGAR|nr:hypothetical protein IW261DRAFT_1422211 [Armillaria novae-zelandiae]
MDSRLHSQVFTDTVNLNHVRVSGGTGTLVRLVVESVGASPVTLELEGCDAKAQDFAGMASHALYLRPLAVEELEVYGPGSSFRLRNVSSLMCSHEDLDGGCMHLGVTLRRLTDGNLKRLYVIDTCRDSGCRDIVHLTRALETRLASLEVLVLDIPFSQSTLEKLLQVVSLYPALKTLYLRGLPLYRAPKIYGLILTCKGASSRPKDVMVLGTS